METQPYKNCPIKHHTKKIIQNGRSLYVGIPKRIVTRFGLEAGDRVCIVEKNEYLLIIFEDK